MHPTTYSIQNHVATPRLYSDSDTSSTGLPDSPRAGSPVRDETAAIFERTINSPSTAKVPRSSVCTAGYSSGETTPLAPRPIAVIKIETTFSNIIHKVASGHLDIRRAQLMIHELLSKVLAYDMLDPNTPINIPVLINGTLQARSFTPIACPLSDGNMAYLFRPVLVEEEVAPMLIFRGTDAVNASGSLRADLGFKALTAHLFTWDIAPQIDVGRSIIESDGVKITNLLRDIHRKYGKVIMGGHSLGGKLASSFSIDKENARYVKELITFNAPGVTKAELAKYEALGESKFKATTCTVSKDLIGNGIGFKRFFGDKHIIEPVGLSIFSFGARHTKCVLSDAANVDRIQAPGKTMLMKNSKILKRLFFPISIALGIIIRLGYVIAALVIEGIHACGGSDKLKAHNALIKGFGFATYFRADYHQISEHERLLHIAKSHYAGLMRNQVNSSYKTYS